MMSISRPLHVVTRSANQWIANDMYCFEHDKSFSRIFTTFDDENFKLQLIHFNKIMLFMYNILPNNLLLTVL